MNELEGRAEQPAHYVIISGYHDYRSKRRANLHFIADELVKRGSVFFFSLRYSYLTRRREDPRHDLWARANRVERVNGVDAYLWRTPIHPFRMPARLRLAERALFGLFARHLPAAARAPIAAATHIFIESGIAIVYLPLLKRLNPTAQIIYMASDSLGAIDQAETIKRAFHRHAHLVDSARLPSPLLRDDVPASIPCYYIPHGIEKEKFATIGPSPYPPGTVNAVSVGSMLFDNTFFEIAGPMFPDITFHVIGSGHKGENTANVIYYPEMPFGYTLPYLKHANFAIAAYGEGGRALSDAYIDEVDAVRVSWTAGRVPGGGGRWKYCTIGIRTRQFGIDRASGNSCLGDEVHTDRVPSMGPSQKPATPAKRV